MVKKQLQSEILLELVLSIVNEKEEAVILQKSIPLYMRKLSCFLGGIVKKDEKDDKIVMPLVARKTGDWQKVKSYFLMHEEKIETAFQHYVSDEGFYYAFNMADYGILILGRKKAFDTTFTHELEPVFNHLGMALIQAYEIEQRKKAEDALRENQKLFSLFIKHSPIYAFIKEVDEDESRILFASENYRDMIGVSGSDMIGKATSELFPPDVAKRFLDDDHKVISQGKVLKLNEYFKGRYYNTIKFPIWMQGKSFLAGYTIEYTEKYMAEKALKESEVNYRRLFNRVSDAIYIMDKNGNFLDVNQGAVEMYGQPKSYLVGRTPVDVSAEGLNDLAATAKAVEMAFSGEPQEIEFWAKRKNGAIFPKEVRLSKGIYFGEEVVYALAHDITERKQAEQALIASEKRYKDLVDMLPEVIYEMDMDLNITYFNQKGFELTGYNSHDLRNGLSALSMISEAEREVARKHLGMRLKGQDVGPKQYKGVNKYGESIQIHLHAAAIHEENKVVGIRGIVLDVTERIKANEALIHAKEKAEESDRLKSAFLANMSHEIRTPMNGILGFAELLKEAQLTGDEQQQYIKIIEQSGSRMLNIINDIISISKVESGQLDLVISETNIDELLDYIYKFFMIEASNKGIEIHVHKDLPDHLAIIESDKEKLYAILTNLMKNAIKFTNTGSIDFGCYCTEKDVHFFVKDTGIGVSEELKHVIFERFRQGSELLTRDYEGAGLGLSITKAYVNMLGGEIYVEDNQETGKGAVFSFNVPFKTTDSIISTSAGIEIRGVKKHKMKPLKVLVVEDHLESEMFIEIVVQEFSKEIIKVDDGLKAVEYCKKNADVDLVLMDIKMTVMDGYEATRQIRKFNKDVVIIAQTAYGLEGDREKSMTAGCSDYISKPVNKENLVAIIGKYFDV